MAPYRRYLKERQSRLFRVLPLTAQVYGRAQILAEQHSSRSHLRSLDLLHLATALEYGVPVIATYDQHLAAGAKVAGLSTIPPRL